MSDIFPSSSQNWTSVPAPGPSAFRTVQRGSVRTNFSWFERRVFVERRFQIETFTAKSTSPTFPRSSKLIRSLAGKPKSGALRSLASSASAASNVSHCLTSASSSQEHLNRHRLILHSLVERAADF
jgi:hypothetical protein